jgi:hypothetical protein
VPPLNAPVFVEPAVKPVMEEVAAEPEVAATPIPAHGVVVMVGPGTLIMGLTPALPISVEPSGIVPPSRGDPTVVPGADSGEPMPVDGVVADDVVAQPADVAAVPVETLEPIPVTPPPSNVELVPLVPAPAAVAVPNEAVLIVLQFEPMAAEPSGTGLNPPGSISVAPSGIPAGLPGDVEPRVPSGDVAPIPGVPIVLWASAAAPLNRVATATNNNRRIDTSCGFLPGK